VADLARLIPDCRVSVDGQALSPEEGGTVTRIAVDLDAELFGSCEIVFNDPQLELINGNKFQSGTAVKVELGFGAKLLSVFEGEVVALEPCFRRDAPVSLRVVCHQSIHRLGLSHKTRALNDVDDNDVIGSIAQEHGLTGEGPTGTKMHKLQGNLTDAAFLKLIAQKEGNQLRIEGKKLVVGPPSGSQVTIAPGDGLNKIKVKLKSLQQVSEITVHGWDPKAQQAIVGTAQPPAGDTGEGARTYGGSRTLSIEHLPPDVSTAEKMAKGRMARIAEGFVTADLDMIGDPRVVPGASLELDKLGEQIDGSYRVDKAGHVFSKRGYFVKASITRISKTTSTSKAEQRRAQQQQNAVAEAAPADPPETTTAAPTVFSAGVDGGMPEESLGASVSADFPAEASDAGVSAEMPEEKSEASVSGEPSEERADASVTADAEESEESGED
jgi:phage protein D